MKSIYTLVPDIQGYINTNEDWYNNVIDDIHRRSLSLHEHNGSKPTLRLSGLGDKCPKALWYSIHHPEFAEDLPPHAKFKYGYGHIIEAMAISLARLSGHEVTGEQDELVVDGIVGHRDCVIDGAVVDIKSCSSIQFLKFKNRTLANDDPFGYGYQLDGYILGSYSDPLVHIKDRGFILAIDKTLGHIVLYEHLLRENDIRRRIKEYNSIVACDKPPACQCSVRPEGKSGNIILDTKASYSNYKHLCFPNLRTFIYADGPKYFTKVVREPDVPEIKRQ